MSKDSLWVIIVLLIVGIGGWFVWSSSQTKVVTSQPSVVVTATPTISTTAKVSPTPTVPPKSIALEQTGVSGQSGTAIFESAGDSTRVTITMIGKKSTVPQPSHIHLGKCPTPGNVKYPLNNVVDGKSVTTLAVKIDDLFSMLPLAVNVHKSVEEASIYTACGDLR
jgi:hypothetical protein